MIFPERVFGRSPVQMIRFGRAIFEIRIATCSRICVGDLIGAVDVALEGDEGADRLTRGLVGLADHRRLGHLAVRDDRGLDLSGRHAMPGDVDHVVDPAEDPEVAVLVLAGGVTDDVGRVAEPPVVGLPVPVVLLVQRPQHPGPRPPQHQQPLGAVLDLVSVLVDHRGVDPRQRLGRRAGLGLGDPGQRADQDVPGLRLPPRVDDRAAFAADHLVVPEPCLRVDRLADGAQQAQRRRGRACPGARLPTSCRRGSRSAPCRGSSPRSAR